jgi:hypothetical protein
MLIMVSITLSVPETTRNIMKEFPEVNWSHIVRTKIIEQAKMLQLKKEMLSELSKEKEFTSWATRVVREGRTK